MAVQGREPRSSAGMCHVAHPSETDRMNAGALRHVGVERLRRGRFQPRRDFPDEGLAELAESIRSQGVVQPIVVRSLGGEDYEIVAGERRWRAAQRAGLHEVPVLVRELDDTAAAVLALLENTQREDLNPGEAAEGVARLVEEFGLTHQEVAEALGRKREHVSHLLRVTRLEPPVKALVASGALSFGHAKVLAGLPPARQVDLAREAADRGWSVRRLEQRAKAPAAGSVGRENRDPNLEQLERRVGETVGSPTRLEYDGASRRGTITLTFHSHEELEGILSRLGISPEEP